MMKQKLKAKSLYFNSLFSQWLKEVKESRVSLYSLALEVKSVVLCGESWDRTRFSRNTFMTYMAVGNMPGMYIECVKLNQV